MQRAFRVVAVVAGLAAAGFVIHADTTPPSEAADIQLQLGNLMFDEGRFGPAFDAYQHALKTDDMVEQRAARSGLIKSALRIAKFDVARVEAEKLAKAEPTSPDAMSLYGDALWSAGLFQGAQEQYEKALAIEPQQARGLHGMARSLLARSRVDEAMNAAQAALRLAPRDMEIHHTVGAIYERMHRYEQAAAAYMNFINLLPHKDTSEKAAWSRAEVRFLQSFGERTPFQMEPGAEDVVYTVDFKLVKDKMLVQGRVNNGDWQDFVVDTGSENTVISERTADRRNVRPITYTLSAGVGEVGLRGLQLARIDSLQIGALKVRNVPCIIKNPPLRDLPTREMESFSPLALGFSMTVDYKQHKLTFGRHLPEEPADIELPLWLYRLATVQGLVAKSLPADFVVDTGGEVISISQATAEALGIDAPSVGRRIPLQVYGTSGWDRDAFLLVPGVDLSFDTIHYNRFPVVVLNLTAPSALLGFELGGIVGHRFLSNYRFDIDLERSVLRLTRS